MQIKKGTFFSLLSFLLTINIAGCNGISSEKILLKTPQNLTIDGTFLDWEDIDNASGYIVKIGSLETECSDSQYELAQLSLAENSYYIMVKAKGNENYLDSDYSRAILYNVNLDENDSNINTDIQTDLRMSLNRYEVVSAPVESNSLPIIRSATDYTYNYFFLDGGYINNAPISSSTGIMYDGVTPIKVTFSKSNLSSSNVTSSIQKTISETISTTWTGSAKLSLAAEGKLGFKILSELKLGIGAEYSRQWGTITDKANSYSDSYSVASELAEQLTTTLEYTIGNNNEEPGIYRLSMFSISDIYYLVKTSRDNKELISIEAVLCPRENQFCGIDYSKDGLFEKTSTSDLMNWPENFYENYEIPTDTFTSTITLDVQGGYEDEISKKQVVTIGMPFSLPVPRRPEMSFVGWYDSPNGNGTKFTDSNGNSLENWNLPNDVILYAFWVKNNNIIGIENLTIPDNELYSQKSSPFSIGLNINGLKEAGYNYLNIRIAAWCSNYDPKLKTRTRHLLFTDYVDDTLINTWDFEVDGFSGVEEHSLPINKFNTNGQYQLQLLSDQSDAYNERLTLNDIYIYVTAKK